MAGALSKRIPCQLCNSRKGNSIFCSLTSGQIDLLEPYRTTKTYRKRDLVFSEGDDTNGIYCIFSGLIKIYKTSETGRENILRVVHPGNIIGQSHLFLKQKRTHSASAISDSMLCFIETDGIEKLLKKSLSLNQLFLREISDELSEAHEKIQFLSEKSAEERLRHYLSFFTEETRKNRDLLLSREEISSLIGVRSETVIRIFSDWEKRGWISLKGKRLAIHRPEFIYEKNR